MHRTEPLGITLRAARWRVLESEAGGETAGSTGWQYRGCPRKLLILDARP